MFHFFFCAFGIELTIQMGLEMAFTLEHAPSAPQALRFEGKRSYFDTKHELALDFYQKNDPSEVCVL